MTKCIATNLNIAARNMLQAIGACGAAACFVACAQQGAFARVLRVCPRGRAAGFPRARLLCSSRHRCLRKARVSTRRMHNRTHTCTRTLQAP